MHVAGFIVGARPSEDLVRDEDGDRVRVLEVLVKEEALPEFSYFQPVVLSTMTPATRERS